jgi:hypothetical protein
MAHRSGSTSGEWKRSTVGYSGTGNRKGRQHARPHLTYRATPRLYFFSTPSMTGLSKLAEPDEEKGVGSCPDRSASGAARIRRGPPRNN